MPKGVYKRISKMEEDQRKRIGCDVCKVNKATERFEGTLGHLLWICLDCYAGLIKLTNE